MYVVAGWNDGKEELEVMTLERAVAKFPEVLGGQRTLHDHASLVEAVDVVNQEGNYHDFVLRPAWPFEIVRLVQEVKR